MDLIVSPNPHLPLLMPEKHIQISKRKGNKTKELPGTQMCMSDVSLELARKIIVSGQQIQKAVAPNLVIHTDGPRRNWNSVGAEILGSQQRLKSTQMANTWMGEVTHHSLTVAKLMCPGDSTWTSNFIENMASSCCPYH